MRDMKARVGNRPIEGVVGHFEAKGVNENGEYLIDMHQERGMKVGNETHGLRR